MAKIIQPTKEIRDDNITKAVERILRGAERPISERIVIDVQQGECVEISYTIKEIIVPEAKNEAATSNNIEEDQP